MNRIDVGPVTIEITAPPALVFRVMGDSAQRTQPSIALHRDLGGRLADLAAGRNLVIDYFRSRRCGVLVGDLAVSWRTAVPGPSFAAVAPMESVPVYVDRRLLDVLGRAMPELWPGGWFRGGTPSIRLALPELWTDFLDGPVVMGPRVTA